MAPEIRYTKLFINNEWVDSISGKTFDTYNPHDGSVIAKVSEGDKADIDLAVAAAKKAFARNSEWRLMDARQRGKILNRFADLVQEEASYLAELESYNNGMLLQLSSRLTSNAVDGIRYTASLADKIEGSTIPADGDVFCYTLKQPVGVCGLILPWNVPILMFLNKVVTALAAGCTTVVKPAEQTPLTALYLASLLQKAGVPAGVVNIVNGYGETAGVALTHHPDVAKISFTGSLEVGKLIQQAAGANNLKRITLELGGKSPLVIMNDADLATAIRFAALGVFTHQGQICIAASRLFVQSGIYDQFVKGAVEVAKTLKIGNPFDSQSQHGPQIDEGMMKKVLGYIEKGKQEGAKLLVGGKQAGSKGYYIEPTVFADVQDDMTIAKEEIFGPVQSILKFETLDEVIDRANATNYGLAAGIFTTNVNNAIQFANNVEAGVVWVNNYMGGGGQAPFGGFKESGIGREGGKHGVDEYLEVKTVTISVPKKVSN
ncbi:retinal dehydrogenase 1-like [Zerene cesonia]|uniref:retinal dehydrogenase 1-like n=1 Tax=Zerene cesonia TaxID=33412 RepID=UPI0018E53FFB|nr:retinal dehydrogenase 1-like [Zerene cesonia]